jgi:hypothetical protein
VPVLRGLVFTTRPVGLVTGVTDDALDSALDAPTDVVDATAAGGEELAAGGAMLAVLEAGVAADAGFIVDPRFRARTINVAPIDAMMTSAKIEIMSALLLRFGSRSAEDDCSSATDARDMLPLWVGGASCNAPGVDSG